MNSELTIYNLMGYPIAYIAVYENFNIYMWNGSPAAYLYAGEYIYGFNGEHIGWFDKGVVYDCQGKYVGSLIDNLQSIAQITPLKSIKKITPMKNLRNIPKIKPIFSTFKRGNPNSLEDMLLRGIKA